MAIRSNKALNKDALPEYGQADLSEKFSVWIINNWKSIILIFALFIGVFFASFSYSKHKINKEKEAFLSFNQAMKSYQGLTSQSTEEGMKNVKESLNNVIKSFPDKKASDFARLYLGHLSYKSEKYDEALTQYTKISKKAKKGTLINVLAKEGMAYSYLGQKKYQEAISILKNLIEKDKTYSKRESYLKLAEAYEGLKDNESLLATLLKITEEFPDDSENEIIKNKIALLKKDK